MPNVTQENIDRFSGFADLYNASRPVPPELILKIILKYLPAPPHTVIDIGSGTGLSTMIWRDIAPQVIGIEPNDDMRNAAPSVNNITYQKGYSNQTGLPDASADVVTISQAFHWMDIPSTLDEVWRILKPGGVFAVYDCDWPPCVDWVVEQAESDLVLKCDAINPPECKNNKGAYIRQFNEYGKFSFVREVVCHSVEPCTPERMMGIAVSQGCVQGALKLDPAVQKDVDAFCGVVRERCKDNFEIVFSYRVRLGIK